MATRAEPLPETLDLLILKTVSLPLLHGLSGIQQTSGAALRAEQESLYPPLYLPYSSPGRQASSSATCGREGPVSHPEGQDVAAGGRPR
jgi:hypothetical protein